MNKSSNGLVRFITAGSVDDGKSTLIGRLLFLQIRCIFYFLLSCHKVLLAYRIGIYLVLITKMNSLVLTQ